ncbi:MAG: hypothetical protein DLM62_08265 [Pseudonocardiales bacterium]|nr:MAG: hypothetical protein DLM62_08265 [Pseudonocardiales bacterium]
MTRPTPPGGPGPGTAGLPAAPLFEERVAAVPPPGALMTVTCSPRQELLRLAGLAAAERRDLPLLRRRADPKGKADQGGQHTHKVQA